MGAEHLIDHLKCQLSEVYEEISLIYKKKGWCGFSEYEKDRLEKLESQKDYLLSEIANKCIVNNPELVRKIEDIVRIEIERRYSKYIKMMGV